jgi:hypothetical protein
MSAADVAHQLIVRVGDHGGRLWLTDGKIQYSGPLPSEDLLADLKCHRAELIAYLAPQPPEPCRDGCGKLMPAGQSCTAYAVRSVAEWREEKERKRRAMTNGCIKCEMHA